MFDLCCFSFLPFFFFFGLFFKLKFPISRCQTRRLSISLLFSKKNKEWSQHHWTVEVGRDGGSQLQGQRGQAALRTVPSGGFKYLWGWRLRSFCEQVTYRACLSWWWKRSYWFLVGIVHALVCIHCFFCFLCASPSSLHPPAGWLWTATRFSFSPPLTRLRKPRSLSLFSRHVHQHPTVFVTVMYRDDKVIFYFR